MACMKYGIAPHAITGGLFIFARETLRVPGAGVLAVLSGSFLIHSLFIAVGNAAIVRDFADKRSRN